MGTGAVQLGRDSLVGPDPTWEALPLQQREQWLDDIDDFPPPPLLLELLQKDLRLETYDPLRLTEKLSHDSVLTGRILARANSAAFAPLETVTSLRQALVHLGFNLVRNTVLRYQIEQSALKLKGMAREHILTIQRSSDQGAIIAFNWARAAGLPDAAAVATRCLLARLGTFLIARRHPQQMPAYFSAGHEPQRLNFEANTFGLTSRSLTYKVAQAWNLPQDLQFTLFHLWTPLFAEVRDRAACIGCAALALSFDPPLHREDLTAWLSLSVHERLRENLEAVKALSKLPSVIESEIYQTEMASLDDAPY
jgi:HD-like signal output (HDOD) protein